MRNKDIKTRFDNKGFSPMAYAKAYAREKNKREIEKTRVTINKILSGAATGTYKQEDGLTRRIIAQLKKDGVWIGPLPWEK
ncbi:MAG: hypothetical protein PQJ49_11630 [Sphaerochaetaceae bacterium]|nr:hypothetical protein [Sphaerochaetaceae bacterium]